MIPHMPLAFLSNLFQMDGLIILVVGLLIFGRRLPEVGKNLGKTIVEFKKGLSGAYSEDEKSDPPQEPEAIEPKRLQNSANTRVAVTRKSLPQTEEV